MSRIQSITDLLHKRELYQSELRFREESNQSVITDDNLSELLSSRKKQILICGGTGCRASQSEQIIENFKKENRKHQLSDFVDVMQTGCCC